MCNCCWWCLLLVLLCLCFSAEPAGASPAPAAAAAATAAAVVARARNQKQHSGGSSSSSGGGGGDGGDSCRGAARPPSSPPSPLSPERHGAPRKLHGKFLHITDLHPDPYYRVHSLTSEDAACHRGAGPAGYYGAETSDCDAPYALVNATLAWVGAHLRDTVDFVVWTGDSARHASGDVPRTEAQVLDANRRLADMFAATFAPRGSAAGLDSHGHGHGHDHHNNVGSGGGGGGEDDDDDIDDSDAGRGSGDDGGSLAVPIVPTIGNNDVLPHNEMRAGPNRWTRAYLDIWRKFIPHSQRPAFEQGGWFFVEVIPDRLAVFSLNTMYFFTSNEQVGGCAGRSQPGYQHMEWLRVQLDELRRRRMKAMFIGHVAPAFTKSKKSWHASCWRKYTLWARQYRDVLVGAFYGHMNIDHFMLHDSAEALELDLDLDLDLSAPSGADTEIEIGSSSGSSSGEEHAVGHTHGRVTAQGKPRYLKELRKSWSKLSRPPSLHGSRKKRHDDKWREYLDAIGGEWAERYIVTHVAPSVVPNYFPSLRVIEYNITSLGLDADSTGTAGEHASATPSEIRRASADARQASEYTASAADEADDDDATPLEEGRRRRGQAHGWRKYRVPKAPAKTAPPGPAYSPQTFTLLGFTQYFANLTDLNNDFVQDQAQVPTPASSAPEVVAAPAMHAPANGSADEDRGGVHAAKWHPGKHAGAPLPGDQFAQPPKPFGFAVEYSTRDDDDVYRLRDLTVKSYLRLAQRIGRRKPGSDDGDDFDHYNDDFGDAAVDGEEEDDDDADDDVAGDDGQGDDSRRLQLDEADHDACSAEMASAQRPRLQPRPRPSQWPPARAASAQQQVLRQEGNAAAAATEAAEPTTTEDQNEPKTRTEMEEDMMTETTTKKKKGKHKHRRRMANKVWFAFVRRAFVGAVDDDELCRKFGSSD